MLEKKDVGEIWRGVIPTPSSRWIYIDSRGRGQIRSAEAAAQDPLHISVRGDPIAEFRLN